MAKNPKSEPSNIERFNSPPKLFGFHLSAPPAPVVVVGTTEPKSGLQCRFCDRTFLNSQGLGGHQNAHKRERQIRRTRIQQRNLVHQKVLVPRPGFTSSVININRSTISSPPPSFSSSSSSSSSSSMVCHVKPQQLIRPLLVMDCPRPTSTTRVYLEEGNNSLREIIDHVGSGVVKMEDVNIDLRL